METNLGFAETLRSSDKYNELRARLNFAKFLSEEAAEARKHGTDSEWLVSELIPGLVYKEEKDGITVHQKTPNEEFDWSPDGGIIGGLILTSSAIDLLGENVHTLFSCTFTDSWENLSLGRLTLRDCHFDEAKADRFLGIGSKFVECSFVNMDVSDLYVGGALFYSCNMDSLVVKKLTGGGDAPGKEMTVVFEEVSLENATFLSGVLPFAHFARSTLNNTKFGELKLDHVSFPYCDLTNVDLTKADLSRNVSFHNASSLHGCQMTRNNLDALEGYGGLTLSQRRDLRIEDPIATLRNEFSGFWAAIHVGALALFLLPYIIYFLQLYLKSAPICDGICEPVAYRFGQFVYTGGHMDGNFNWTFVAFMLLLFYNFFRILLLWKTKQLELESIVSGVMPEFTFQGFWGVIYTVTNVGFWFNLVLLIFHSSNFLMRLVPIGI